jgi:hypothetical protein
MDLKIIFKTVPAIVNQTKDLTDDQKLVAKALPRTTVMQS